MHYYSARNHPYDPTFPIVYPRCGALFQQLAAHHISFRNFGELVGQVTSQAPTAQVAPATACATPGGTYDSVSVASTDEAYPNNLTLTSVPDTDRLTEFEKTYAPLVAANQVPSFTYVLMGNDHTDGTTPGDPTPQALVATNDQAVGGLVEYLSHTPQWSSTATNPAAATGTASALHADTSQIDIAGPLLEAQLWEATRLGAPLPKAIADELLARSSVNPDAVRAWQRAVYADADRDSMGARAPSL